MTVPNMAGAPVTDFDHSIRVVLGDQEWVVYTQRADYPYPDTITLDDQTLAAQVGQDASAMLAALQSLFPDLALACPNLAVQMVDATAGTMTPPT